MQNSYSITPFVGSDGKYHFVYKTTNTHNDKEYIGVHNTSNLDDGYLGSGKNIIRAIEKYSKEKFKREIIKFFNTIEEAYEYESVLVNEEFIKDKNTYNIVKGGYGGHSNMVNVIDKYGNKTKVLNTDPKYISGEFVSIFKNKVIVKDKDGNTMQVSIDDPRYLSGELVSINTGKVVVKDKYNNFYSVPIDDPRYISGEFIYLLVNKITVKDKDGNTKQVSIDDPRYLNGELVGIMKNCKTGKHKNPAKYIKCPHCGKEGREGIMHRWHFDNCISNPNNDSNKILNDRKNGPTKKVTCPHCGTIGGIATMQIYHFNKCLCNPDLSYDEFYNSNRTLKCDIPFTKPRTPEINPRDLKLVLCPHCGKEGKGGNMTRYHFNNCKFRKN